MRPEFRSIDGADGVGHTQRLVLTLVKPLEHAGSRDGCGTVGS